MTHWRDLPPAYGDWKNTHRRFCRWCDRNEFLFDLGKDQRERANLAEKHPQVLAELKEKWQHWNNSMLPITPDVRSHSVNGKMQADKYGVPAP
ncbi:hypothetical protein ACKF11_10630 [Methylobacillus sp. Pita2]|uniref:hypothetical protein n=1 Tax=Methylobacillus sp. Pita2 TaxID=3383245 RepID=UPI0038B65C20